MKSWLEKNDIEIYPKHNEEKSVVAERFIRTLKNRIYKYMTSVSKMFILKQLKHSTIKMKPVDVKSNKYIDSSEEINNKDSKLKIVDTVRTSKYKNIFAKSYTLNWSKEGFVIKKVKSTVPWKYATNGRNGEEVVETFYEKELKKHLKKSLVLKK